MNFAFRLFGVAAVAAVVFLIAGLVAVWAPDRPVAQLVSRWAQPPSKFLEVDGMQVHVRDEGPRNDPHPIVLLHGTAASLHTWDAWVSALKDQRRVIRFDLPGFGLTGPNKTQNYSIDSYVGFVGAMLDKLGVDQVVLVGNSLGGHIAWATAYAKPQRVQKLVLIDAGGYAISVQDVPIGFRLARVPGLRGLMEMVLPRGVVQSSLRNVYGDPDKVSPELVDRYYELMLRAGNRRALAKRFQQGLWGDVEHIRALKQPTLILWGSKDRLIPPDNGREFHKDIVGSKLVQFDQLGHVPHEEDPVSTVREFKQFLLSTGP